jgi:DNA repair protein RecO (recombination protein O)
MERFADDALVLSTLDYGEADRVVTLLTRAHGRLSAFASGARKSKRRFAGAFEAGTHLRIHVVERRGDTFRLDAADILQSFHHLRQALALIARALYSLELCRELTRDSEPHEALYLALLDYLRLLDGGRAGPTSLLKFELDALAHAGLRPHFAPCAVCGASTGEAPRFDAEQGGIVCAGCAARVPHGIPVSPGLVSSLVELQAGARQPWPPDERARGRELLNRFITHHLGRRLKSVDFMQQVGTD